MPKIAASIVVPVCGPLRRNAVVELDNKGRIVAVGRSRAAFTEMAGVEYYSGILIPGLADVMCGNGKSGHFLLGRGVRIAGRIGKPIDKDGHYYGDLQEIKDCSGKNKSYPDEPLKVIWQNRYGGTVEYRVFKDMEHFGKFFNIHGGKEICYYKNSGEGLPVLAGYGHLDILEVMLELQEGPQGFSFVQLLTMATLNGAIALGCDKVAGYLAPGTKPGLNIIEGADLNKIRLLPSSRLRRLY